MENSSEETRIQTRFDHSCGRRVCRNGSRIVLLRAEVKGEL
jgi:hypothetical protein